MLSLSYVDVCASFFFFDASTSIFCHGPSFRAWPFFCLAPSLAPFSIHGLVLPRPRFFLDPPLVSRTVFRLYLFLHLYAILPRRPRVRRRSLLFVPRKNRVRWRGGFLGGGLFSNRPPPMCPPFSPSTSPRFCPSPLFSPSSFIPTSLAPSYAEFLFFALSVFF